MKRFDKAVIRTSAYPFDYIKRLFEMELDQAVSTLLNDPFFIRAVSLASPE